ncbi:hypothetical protein SAY87_030943 [Trapa incisa]|uniref:Uncharacterized protein n=1 Tax=Trapa incisa TaxID=236973 RepID=A0AAN7KNE0_9MYRT|nr:hypothetical protein SAY87_030943 [Trapa incisa]
MEGLRNRVMDYMEDQKSFMDLVLAVYSTMNGNNDQPVSYEGFRSFMATSGFAAGVDPFAFFGQLRREGHDTLEIIDVALFCLICYGGKPICAGCSRFVPGDDYFTCLQCFTTDGNIPFNLCPDCNRNIGGHLDHVHPENDYIDNVQMLQLLHNEGNEHQMFWRDGAILVQFAEVLTAIRVFVTLY